MKTRNDINKEKILEAASHIVTTRGIEPSLADIAAEMGISKGTLYYYYHSKSDLIFDITNRHFDQITRQVVENIECLAPGTQPAVIISQAMSILVGETTRGRLHHYLIEEAVSSNPGLKEKFMEKYREWNETICQVIARILPDEPHKETLSRIILATVDGLILQKLVGVNDFSIDEIAHFFTGGKPD